MWSTSGRNQPSGAPNKLAFTLNDIQDHKLEDQLRFDTLQTNIDELETSVEKLYSKKHMPKHFHKPNYILHIKQKQLINEMIMIRIEARLLRTLKIFQTASLSRRKWQKSFQWNNSPTPSPQLEGISILNSWPKRKPQKSSRNGNQFSLEIKVNCEEPKRLKNLRKLWLTRKSPLT